MFQGGDLLDPKQAKTALHKLFQRMPVVKLEALYRTLKTHSRTSVFRRLKAVGYFSSYTHRGRYYTLRGIPQFDPLGLWHYRDVGFSRMGSLKATALNLVLSSADGRTHRELQGFLRVRVHNELLDLVRSKKLRSEAWTRGSLYLSALPSRGAKQLTRRKAQGIQADAASGPLAPGTVIEVLSELVRAAKVETPPPELADRLAARGVAVTIEQVRGVFHRYKLGGKKGARSPRSRP